MVARRQRDHIQRELPVLAKIVSQLTPQKAAATPLKDRQEIARWLSRCSSRLTAVATHHDTPQDQQMKLSRLAGQADRLLEMLKNL